MFWEPVTHYEVQNYLLTLNLKKACGFDDIPARLLKDAAEVCVCIGFLQTCINQM